MKTNKIRLAISLLFLCAQTWAQDVIIKSDKTELTVKVDEITTNTVKYRPFTRLDGPVYNLDKSEIFLIIYKDGSRETFAKPVPAVAPSEPASVNSETPRGMTSSPLATLPSNPVAEQPKPASRGWSYGVGYMTATGAFATTHGYTTESGYYWLFGQRQTAGISLDIGYMGFFQANSPTFGTIMANTFARLSPTSKVYFGGGLGYSTIGVPIVDRYGLSQKTYVSGAGSKAFMGVGSFRATLAWPSFESGSGSLFTFGYCTNPFK